MLLDLSTNVNMTLDAKHCCVWLHWYQI